MYLSVNIALFLLLQVVAALLFRWASTASQVYWWGMGLGNSIGMISIFMLINIYKVLNPNLTLAICAGGSFLLTQVALSIVCKTQINFLPSLGIIMIVGGITIMALSK